MGLKKPTAFPDCPRQVCVWCSFPTRSLSNAVVSPLRFFFLQIYFKVFFGSRRCQVGWGLVRTGAKKLQQSQENI